MLSHIVALGHRLRVQVAASVSATENQLAACESAFLLAPGSACPQTLRLRERAASVGGILVELNDASVLVAAVGQDTETLFPPRPGLTFRRLWFIIR